MFCQRYANDGSEKGEYESTIASGVVSDFDLFSGARSYERLSRADEWLIFGGCTV